MSEQQRGQIAEVPATEIWKRWLGQTVNGQFQLHQYLGGSGSGAAYLTEYDHQPAAIHLVLEGSPENERQLASWQLAAELSHVNLTRVFELGRCQIEDAKLSYAVTEFADENLGQILAQRALTAQETTEMLKPTLGALAYLHGKGLVHGGLSPANIMANGDEIKLSSSFLGRAGEPIRNAHSYAPPEALSSSAGDVWSLGMILVEALTQRLPSWHRNAQGNPELPESLPSPLADVARHCLRRESGQRWSVQEIIERLDPSAASPRPQQPEERASAAEPAKLPTKQTAPAPKRPVETTQSVTTVVRPKRKAQGNFAPSKNRYLAPGLIVFLLVAGFVAVQLLNRRSNSKIEAPQQNETPSQTTTQQPPQLATSAAPAESSTIGEAPSPVTPTEPPTPSNAPADETLSPSRSAKAPDVAAVGPADAAVVDQVLPDASSKAQKSIRGTVRVGIKVTVDGSGNVSDAMIESGGPSRYFANLALEAARQWKFAAGGSAAGNWILRFDFTSEGVKASAKPSAF